MAHIFKAGKMISNQVDSMLTGAVFAEPVYNGSVVALGDVVKDEVYSDEGAKYEDNEWDIYEGTAPKATAGEALGFVDFDGIKELESDGNIYKGIDHRLYDLQVPAGRQTRVRRLALHDKFWLADGNFSAVPTKGEYATIEAGKYTLKPEATLPEGGATTLTVKILAAYDLTTGMRSNGKEYLVEVVAL